MPDESAPNPGTLLQAFGPPAGSAPRPLRAPAAVDAEGRVYVGLGSTLVALGPAGEVLWARALPAPIPGPVAIGPDGLARVHSGDGGLYAFAPDGSVRWGPVGVGAPLGFAAPTVDRAGNTYIQGHDGPIERVGPDGTLGEAPFWDAGRRLDAPAVILDDAYYVGGDDHHLLAIEIGRGAGRPRWDASSGRGRAGWSIHSEPVPAPGGRVIVASRDQAMHAFEADGTPAWNSDLGGQLLGSPVIDGPGLVFVGVSRSPGRGFDPTGALVVVDARDGSVRFEAEAHGAVESTPVIGSDQVVYFGDNFGSIHAVAPSGETLWVGSAGSAVRSAGAIVGPGRVAFGTDAGQLVIFACSSEAVAPAGWPKYRGDPRQSGSKPSATGHSGTPGQAPGG